MDGEAEAVFRSLVKRSAGNERRVEAVWAMRAEGRGDEEHEEQKEDWDEERDLEARTSERLEGEPGVTHSRIEV